MSDYIKREDALKVFDTDSMIKAWHKTESIPSADVALVRHGRWEEIDDLDFDTLYRCSVCGEEFYLIDGTPEENQYRYCPSCGARMDGEENE